MSMSHTVYLIYSAKIIFIKHQMVMSSKCGELYCRSRNRNIIPPGPLDAACVASIIGMQCVWTAFNRPQLPIEDPQSTTTTIPVSQWGLPD